MAWLHAPSPYMVTHTIDHTMVDSNETNVPTLFLIDDLGAEGNSYLRSDALDIKIFDADSQNECPREVSRYNAGADDGECWYLAESISTIADTVAEIYFGSGNSYANDTEVWDNANAHLVAHLEEASGNFADSTANGYTLTATNIAGYQAAGKIGYGADFEASSFSRAANSYAGNFEYNQAHSGFAWVTLESIGILEILFSRQENSGNYRGWNFSRLNDNYFYFSLYNTLANYMQVRTTNAYTTTGTLFHVGYTYNGVNQSGIKIYINGSSAALTNISNTLGSNTILNASKFCISTRTDVNAFPWDGIIDEAMIFSEEKSAGYTKHLYNTTYQPSTYGEISAIITNSGGGITFTKQRRNFIYRRRR